MTSGEDFSGEKLIAFEESMSTDQTQCYTNITKTLIEQVSGIPKIKQLEFQKRCVQKALSLVRSALAELEKAHKEAEVASSKDVKESVPQLEVAISNLTDTEYRLSKVIE